MDHKIKKFFLFIILFLLQSCSGGRIGNFIESSFNNIEEPKIKEETKNNLNKIVVKSGVNDGKNKNIEEPKIKEETKNNLDKIVVKPEVNDGKNKNIEKPKIKKETKNNFNKIAVVSEVNDGKNKNIELTKIEDNTKSNLKEKIFIKPEEKLKNNKKITKQIISSERKQYQPKSYKIILILKEVDPKDPIESLSTILRNSDVNFEIEKIERFFESKNKNIKGN